MSDVMTPSVDVRSTRSWNSRMWGDLVVRVGVFAALMLSWHFYALGQPPTMVPGPLAVLEKAQLLIFSQNVIVSAIYVSLQSLAIGLSAAIVVGIAVGVLMGRVAIFDRLLDPYVSFLYAVPSIVWVPLAVIWIGLGLQLRAVLVFLASVFPVIINTSTGVKEIPEDMLDVGWSFCAPRREVLTSIVIPASLPGILTGVRQALAQGIVMMIIAEMLVMITGLGGLMIEFSNFFRTAELFVPLLVIMVLSLGLTSLMRYLTRRLAPWASFDET
jgi:ABC-type nitrate/sulfonate/bicarbonate transport system permease component